MAAKEDETHRAKEKGFNDAPKDPENASVDPIVAQRDLIITEIETSDGNLGASLRSVYEGDDPSAFMARLDSSIKQHDREIEHMCNYHYQGFIESVRSLLQVRTDVDKLKDEIQTTNKGVQKAGTSLLEKGQELTRARRTKANIERASETLTFCLPVLETYSKLKEQMRTKRYYPALKTLEQLEHTHLPRVRKYRFCQPMCETIPKLRDSIKEASMSDLKDFLENIRKHSEKIGQVAMKHAAEQHGMDVNLALPRPSAPKKKKAPPPPNPFTGLVDKRQAPPPPNPFGGDEEEEEEDGEDDGFLFNAEESISAQDMVDFSPVYRCLHIYSVLGAKDQFESYYRKQRRKQARLALQPPPHMDRAKRLVETHGKDPNIKDTLEAYKKYCHDIIGFFVVEEHILTTTTGLVTRAYIDELWEMALAKIVAVLRTHIGFCTDPSLMLQVKALIMLFCHTLKGYGFTVSQLYDILLEIRDNYSEILMRKWVEVFNSIFAEDNYTPIRVSTAEEYIEVTSVYPFKDEDLEEAPFPKAFPFSQFVPKVYCQVKEYIYACLKFSEDLHLSITEQETMIYKFSQQFLENCLHNCFSSHIRSRRLNLLQLIQISINMNYLEKSCTYLEGFISNITGAEKENVYVSKLQGTSMFKDSRSEAEAQIYKQINNKVDEFFDLASYDWVLEVPSGRPSEHIHDLIAFLQSTFFSFTNLPEKVAQTTCMSACQHIAKQLMKQLHDVNVRVITMPALQHFNLDLQMCEEFAKSKPVPGLDADVLTLAFTELRQLMNLFLKWDWTNYVAEFGKDYSVYLRVSAQTCILLLEKLREAEKKKNNLLTKFKKNERDKTRLVETLLKQLRQLSASQLA